MNNNCNECSHTTREEWAKNRTAIRCWHEGRQRGYVVALLNRDHDRLPVEAPAWCGKRTGEDCG